MENQNTQNYSGAIFAFLGWLTTRNELVGPFGATETPGDLPNLIERFCEHQGWESPSDDFFNTLKPYPNN